MAMRVIIPVAGVGSRMRPHTHTTPKVLLQVAGKPMIDHILDELKQYDIESVTMVVGHLGDQVIEYVTRRYQFTFHFIHQKELGGLGQAIWLTREFHAGSDSPLLIVLGDTLFSADFKNIIGAPCDYIGVKEVADPRRFGVIELEGDRIARMVEKPAQPKSNLAIVGIYYFAQGGKLFAALDDLIASGRRTAGEFQLTDAMQAMLEQGAVMKPFVIDGWYDCGKPETLLQTNRDLLTKYMATVDPARFPTARIIPPVAIGEGATVENALIGPYVTVAEGATIRDSIVTNSVISNNASVERLVLDASIIANDATVSGRTYRLNIGDHSELTIG
jgi:glucose-1-phosphate thymidylyltransferase